VPTTPAKEKKVRSKRKEGERVEKEREGRVKRKGQAEKKRKGGVYDTTSPTQSGREHVPCHVSTKLAH
jgi:hypothetical protein